MLSDVGISRASGSNLCDLNSAIPHTDQPSISYTGTPPDIMRMSPTPWKLGLSIGELGCKGSSFTTSTALSIAAASSVPLIAAYARPKILFARADAPPLHDHEVPVYTITTSKFL